MFWGKSCTLIYVFAIENFLVINIIMYACR